MKKSNLFRIVAYACALSLIACDGTQNPITDGKLDVETEKESDLTPGQHQQKLEDMAVELIGYLNADDTREIVASAEDFSSYIEYFEEPASSAALVAEAAKAAAELSPAKLVAWVTKATTSEDFIIDPNDGEMNPFAGYCYTFNLQTYQWDRSTIDNNAIKFCWGEDSMELVWTNGKRWDWDFVEEGEHYIVYVPATIDFSMKIGGKEHVNIALKTNITDNQTMAPEATMTVNGGYTVKVALAGDVKGIGWNASISKNDKLLVSTVMAVAINDLTNLDNWVEKEWCENCEEYHVYLDPEEYFVEQVKTGEAQLTILNLTIAMVGDFAGLMETEERLYDSLGDTENYYKQFTKALNERMQAVAVYNDTKEKIADVVWQYRKINDYYDDYDYYTIEPIIVFPDGSKFAFEDFFTEGAFRDVINAVEEFAESLDYIGS